MADALRMALKAAIELAEVAALWITDCDDLEMKLSLAEQCGDGARQCRRLSARLAALGVPEYDPRNGGYSKLFAFLRSLQTAEERSSAGYVTGKALSMARLGALAPSAPTRATPRARACWARRSSTRSGATTRRGSASWSAATATEESQARARRAAYRTLELAGETVEPLRSARRWANAR